jgi:hypothetical protein
MLSSVEARALPRGVASDRVGPTLSLPHANGKYPSSAVHTADTAPSIPLVPSQEESLLREAVYGIASDFGPPYMRERVQGGDPPTELWDALAERGYMGVNVPEEYDGGGRGMTELAAVGEDANDIRDYILANYGGTPGVDGTAILGIEGDNPMVFNVTIPINEKEAAIYGAEFAVQHAFADTGFGVIANLTLVDGDVKFNNASLGDQFAVFGMSDSANLIGFYDRHGLQARIAYNWRDKHLVAASHGTGHPNPIYTEAYGQWDISVSYDVNDNLTVFAEGINVTDEYTRQSSRRSEQVLNVVELRPRYNIGLRYTF